MPVVRNLEKVNRIKILYIPPKSLPKEIVIPSTLRTIKELINGPIKTIYLTTGIRAKEVILFSQNNEKNLSVANRYIPKYGTIYGSFIIAVESKNGEYKSLNNEQVVRYQDMFNEESIKKMETIIKRTVAFRRALRRK